ncbi:T9SS type A sorting domain-containing protein [Hymenobacter rubidus]|uniref:T9SS type A sorting domain-containing protein n=1 Tax=Hymenobacter rubidus TaxID=1441626 RepID=UPI00191EB51A|nr:T9SS type A sorting domain-containing protein [Hymenobacter rubidus]
MATVSFLLKEPKADPGIVNTPAKATVSALELQNALDSLRLSATSAIRQKVLVHTLIAATIEQGKFTDFEEYLGRMPTTVNQAHTALSSWLLHYYQMAHRETDAQRMRVALLARYPGDAETENMVRLSTIVAHRASTSASLGQVDVAALRKVAGSGTTSARVACPLARRYEPSCPCRFPTQEAARPLAGRTNTSVHVSTVLGDIFPNPAGEQVHISYSSVVGNGLLYLEVRNTLGQTVQQVPLSGASGEIQLPVGHLAAGLYQVAVVSNGRCLATQRLAVAH